ncbi:MAG: CpaF family protein [Bdellovibrionales bacterium]|nr:CpaF family protein [Bdellovibrionales bacterium]
MSVKLTAEQIRANYFRRATNSRAASSGGLQRSLTTTTSYVVQRAKERVGRSQGDISTAEMSDVELMKLIKSVEEEEGEQLTERERKTALSALATALQNYDVLTPLVTNSDVNDIIVRSYDDISIQTRRHNVSTDYAFTSQESYESFVENLLKRVGKACTTATPVVDAAVDTHVRACVTHKSFSPPGSGPMLTLRVARHKNVSVADLAAWELAPESVLNYLQGLAHYTDATILIAGEVGTGKTTLVRALAAAIDEREAILCIEDTHEILLERDFVRTLLTREANTEGVGRITPAQAIRAGMRMAMNRIILGEMRDSDAAEAFIDVCASGHPGFSTIHARSAKDAVGRLELFLARAQPAVDIGAIRRQIANALSVVVFLAVDSKNQKRRIAEVVEMHPAGEKVIQLSPIFRLRESHQFPIWDRLSGISQFSERLTESGLTLPEPGTELAFPAEALYRNLH